MVPRPDHPASNSTEQAAPRARRATFAVVLLASVATLATLARVLDVDLIDDSYIFLRYARNIAEGHGAVFNVGERVEGFSSPLWTFMLGVAGVAVPDFEMLAYILGLYCGGGAIALLLHGLYKTGRLGGWDLAVLGLGLAGSPALFFWSASGMETALFLLLVTASLMSVLEDRRTAALSIRTGVLLLLAALTRPEGVLLAAYAGAVFICQRRSIRVLFGYAAALTVMLMLRYLYYGAWVPNTYHAKVTFEFPRRLNDGVLYILPAVRANILLLAVLVVALIVLWRRRLHRQVPVAFLGGWIILWGGYVLYVGGDNFALFRFLLPTSPAWFLLLALGWSSIRVHLAPLTRCACLVVLLVAFTVSNMLTYRHQAPGYYGDVKLARSWAKVGRWIERNTPPDTVVATVVPGAFGYFSRRPLIDMLGLTDRTVGLHGDVFRGAVHGHARYNTDYIFQRKPDIVLYHSSGRFTEPVYAYPERIPVRTGYALLDFVSDRRCAERYAYVSVGLDDGTLIEMQKKHTPPVGPIAWSGR